MDSQPNQHQSKQDRSRTRWTASLDKIFADLVAELVQQGQRSNNIFDKKSWKYIREEFNKRTGMNFDKKQLRKHLVVLRTRYYNLKSVFNNQNSFAAWDEPQRMVATEFDMWEDYIEAHPKPETLRIKDCPIYEQLCTIFSESEADGMYAQSSHYEGSVKGTVGVETPSPISCPKTATTPVDPAMQSMFGQDDASSPSGVNLNTSDGRKKRPSETPLSPGTHRRNRKGTDDAAIAEAMSEMASASKLRAVAMTQSADQFSIGSCVKVLDEIHGVDQQLYFAALDLFEDPNLREMFLSLKSEKRLTWLQGKCNAPSNSVV